MRKFICEACGEMMTIPVFTLVTECGDEWHFDSLKCLKQFIDEELKKQNELH
ncbi:MAG: hypothetical protein WC169_12495 [Dehalococcoidia bacterium]|jgi:hypothetical protein